LPLRPIADYFRHCAAAPSAAYAAMSQRFRLILRRHDIFCAAIAAFRQLYFIFIDIFMLRAPMITPFSSRSAIDYFFVSYAQPSHIFAHFAAYFPSPFAFAAMPLLSLSPATPI